MFPCIAGTKVPATARGFHDATTDISIIDKWWADDPHMNVAFSPHTVGLGIVDIDGDEGEASWQKWQAENGEFPPTYTVRTPRGGRHLYYRGILPATQSKLGVHVDTRGVGSYALVPPSRVGSGDYRLEDPRQPAELPPTVGAFLERLKRDNAKAAVSELDLAPNLARAERLLRDYVARHHVAVEGQMGDGRTYAVACEVLNLGISPEKAHELMCDIWNPECAPPWDEDELLTKIENASRYAQNDPGAWAVEPAEQVFASALDKLAADPDEAQPPEPKRRRFRPLTIAELRKRPPPNWLLPGLYPEGGLSLVYGQPGSYKSFLVLSHCLQLASLGQPCAYVAGEGASDVAQRIDAWCLAHEVDGDDIPLHIFEDAPWVSDGTMMEEFICELKLLKPVMVVIDTFARAAVGMNENDARDMGLFVAGMDALKRATGAAVTVIHHTGKDEGRGARGSGALYAATDAAFEVKANDKLKVVAMSCVRQKAGARREQPWTFEGKDLGGSLVFQDITLSEYYAMTKADDALDPKKIGALLRAMGAVGIGAGVPTKVVATDLVQVDPATSDDDREALVSRMCRVLSKKARGALAAYCDGDGEDRLWFVV